MIEITLEELGPSQALDIVSGLRDMGYKQGIDFDFSYSPETYDDFTFGSKKFTKFMFYNQALATYFELRYK